jgi:hypothetical protein
MQATTSLPLPFPVMMCLPVPFRFLMRSQLLIRGESPVARGITRGPSVSAQRCVGADVLVTHAGITGRRA